MKNTRPTVASLAARQDATEQTLAEIQSSLASLVSLLTPAEPAITAPAKTAPAKRTAQQKSDALAGGKGPKVGSAPAKAYRSAKGKEAAKAQVTALWAKTLADAGVKRAKDLTPAQMDAYRAGSKAIWAAVPKTRTTKA